MTTEPSAKARTVRFGTFEADLGTRELRKGGVRIKLQGQPFEVFAMLLERPGEVVPREELQQRLWRSDTFVDFDHGVNTAINRLREALGDRPRIRASSKRCRVAVTALLPQLKHRRRLQRRRYRTLRLPILRPTASYRR